MSRSRSLILLAVAIVLVAGVAAAVVSLLVKPAEDNRLLHSSLREIAALPYLQWSAVDDPERQRVVLHEPELAWQGLNVYCPENQPSGFVLDMNGRIVLEVSDPRPEPENCRLFEPWGENFLLLTKEGSLLLLDRESKILWEDNLAFHHDAVIAADGRTVALTEEVGYHPRITWWKPIENNSLVVLSPEGELVDSLSFAELIEVDPELLELAKNADRPVLDPDDNVINANSVEVLEEDLVIDGERLFSRGQVLICWRQLDLVGVVDLDRRELVWWWGPGELEHPHHPSILPDGRILIFDNGKFREWSRVIELNPATGEIEWEFRADPVEAFYSRSRGAAQRLPNGNTLVTESTKGHVFEVTPEGEVVWAFWEPRMRESGMLGGLERHTIYRMMRMPAPEATASRTAPGG